MTSTPLRTGKFKSFDGTSVYYEVRGLGEPVVLVYGIACLMNHWRYQVDFLSKHFQVITFDLRGHHRTDVPAQLKNISIEAIAKDIPFLLREVGIKKAHFVAHSFGVQVLVKTYDLAPEVFLSLSMVNGFAKNPIKGMFGLDVVEPFFHMLRGAYEKKPELLDKIWKTTTDNPLTAVGTALAGGFNLKLTPFKDIEIYVRGVSNLSLKIFIPLFEDMMAFRGDKLCAKIKLPCLIISGDRDLVTPMKFQHEMHDAIKGSELLVVPYGSHCTQLDFSEFVNLKLLHFLKSAVSAIA
jgi:pimeloyl-ACP methyl ester carboxylesterase